jgi:TatD DNase family protein
MLIDTHAHLDYPDFTADFDAVLSRAGAAGVDRIVTIGTGLASSERAIALAEAHAGVVYAVVGVHPTNVHEEPPDAVASLRRLAVHPRVAAIGETGLDYHHLPGGKMPPGPEADAANAACRAAQAASFRQQLDLAAELGLNVVIHQRDAWADTLDILRAYTGRLRGVFHCFGGSPAQAAEVISLGHLVSFTGIVTFKNGAGVRETAASVPADRFMVETDCPYLAPVPFRGKRCEPAHTREVAAAVAQARGDSLEAVAAQSTQTAEGFFRLGPTRR